MHVAASARLVLARRPWIYWVVVALLAAGAAAVAHGEMSSIAAERDRWGTTRSVLVASGLLEPGDPLTAELVELPTAAIALGALTEQPVDAVARQRVAPGEVITDLDVASGPGPAALAESGTVVVALSDPLARNVRVNLPVQVVADGLVLADSARVADIVDDVIFVAVARHDGPAVAAAAQQGIATLIYLP
jgi:hypothetical protein